MIGMLAPQHTRDGVAVHFWCAPWWQPRQGRAVLRLGAAAAGSCPCPTHCRWSALPGVVANRVDTDSESSRSAQLFRVRLLLACLLLGATRSTRIRGQIYFSYSSFPNRQLPRARFITVRELTPPTLSILPIALPPTHSYSSAMSSTYNGRPRPQRRGGRSPPWQPTPKSTYRMNCISRCCHTYAQVHARTHNTHTHNHGTTTAQPRTGRP
jgi:hypothetical protein